MGAESLNCGIAVPYNWTTQQHDPRGLGKAQETELKTLIDELNEVLVA
jgi:hypothetical protein